MASEKTPIGFDPLSPDGDGTPSGALSKILSNVGRNDKDEWLAFAGGMGQPNAGGSFTGALGNALKSQSDYRMERDKLMAQYVPLIQQSMVAQFENQRLQQIFGPGGIGAIGQPAAQGAPTAPQGGAQAPAGGQPSAQTAPQGDAATTPGPALPPNASPNHQPIGLEALNPGQLAAIKAFTGGKIDLLPEWKIAKEGFKRDPGSFVQNADGSLQYFEDPKTGLGYDPNSRTLYRLKGSGALADLAGEAAGATSTAQERAKLPFQPPTEVTTKDESGNLKSVKMTPAQQIEAATGVNPLGTQGAAGGITNPGNMRPPGASTGFANFKTPEEGLSALDKNLQSYGKQGVNTVSAIINKWAPPSENDTAAYIADVSKRLSVNPGQPLDMTNPIVRQALSTAITLHEQGPAKVFTAQAPTGMPVASAADVESAKTRGQVSEQSGQKYQDALHDRVEEEFQLVNRNKQIMPLLDRYNTGGISPEERLKVGAAIANSEMLQSVLGAKNAKAMGDKLAGGDVVAGKDLENQLASAGILTMLQTLDKEGKPNRAIFQAVQQAQEGLKSGNATLKDVFTLQKRLYDTHYNEQQAMTRAIKDGSYNPRTWAGDYAKVRNDQLGQAAAPLPSSPFAGFTATLKK